MSASTVANYKPSPLPVTEEAGTRMPWLTEHEPPISAERGVGATTRTAAGDARELIVAWRTGGQLILVVAGATDVWVALRRSEFTELLEALVDVASR